MAEEPYGTFFPENIGPLFTGQTPGQNPVLSKLGNLYDTTPVLAPSPTPISPLPRITGPIPEGPPVVERGPAIIGGPIDEEEDILNRFRPETRAQDEYFKMLSQIPERQKPTIGRRIAAGLSTLGSEGMKGAEQQLYEPYHREMEGFDKRAAILRELAAGERSSNINERQIMSQLLTERRGQRRLEETERANKAKEATNQRIASVREFLAQNPNLQTRIGTNGNFHLFNPRDGSMKDTGIKSGELDEFQRLLLMNAGQAARDALNADSALELERVRQEGREDLAKKEAELKVSLQDRKNLTPEQLKTLQYIRAREISTSWGADAAKMVTYDENSNSFRIKPPAEAWNIFTGTNEEKTRKAAELWIRANKFIYGDDWQPPSNIAGRVTPPAPSTSGRTGQNVAPTVDPARKEKAKALLKQRGLDSSDASVNKFLAQNPNFK